MSITFWQSQDLYNSQLSFRTVAKWYIYILPPTCLWMVSLFVTNLKMFYWLFTQSSSHNLYSPPLERKDCVMSQKNVCIGKDAITCSNWTEFPKAACVILANIFLRNWLVGHSTKWSNIGITLPCQHIFENSISVNIIRLGGS